MSTYVIGDVHGCLDGIFTLLNTINYNEKQDQLFFLGDLVNKGPNSLEVIQWIMQQRNCHTVLGNHDLYVLHNIFNKNITSSDAVRAIASNSLAIEWLRHQPLLIEHNQNLLCHAGIHPKWTNETISHIILNQQSYTSENVLKKFYEQQRPETMLDFHDPLFILASLTEMRFLNPSNFSLEEGTHDNSLDTPNKVAWFDVETINYTKKNIYFGHWARLSSIKNHHTTCLDGGYVYGGLLLCQRLDDGKLFKIKNPKQRT